MAKPFEEGSGSGSGSGVSCQIGTNTTVVDSEATCLELGGKVLPPTKPPGKKVCGGCGAAIAVVAQQFGMTSIDINAAWRKFVELAARSSPDGKVLLESLARADEYIAEAVRDNPSVLGEVTMSLVTGAEFAILIMSEPGSAFDKLKLPKLTKRYFRRSIDGLRKGSSNKKFHKELDLLQRELKRWSRKTVAEVRSRFLGD